tara:strand:- start:678 stop:1178 length:501 start_codon:yes stop_codon:yes gene_type:complete
MVLSENQWRDIKRVKWNTKESRRIREATHDDQLIVGWCGKNKRWMIARIVDATVEVKFGVQTIPTREKVPYTWKVWEDDNGAPLGIKDPRLIPYIRRCDLWRTGAAKYLKQYDHLEWLADGQRRSEEDEQQYYAKHVIYPRVKKAADALCGYNYNKSHSQRFFFGS